MTLSLFSFLDMNLPYFKDEDVRNAKGQSGIRFTLCNPLTQAQRAKLKSYQNIILSTCVYRYAPEIQYDTVILLT